jgi:hypothetical protein
MAYLVTVTALFVIYTWMLCAEVVSTFLNTTLKRTSSEHKERPDQQAGQYG